MNTKLGINKTFNKCARLLEVFFLSSMLFKTLNIEIQNFILQFRGNIFANLFGDSGIVKFNFGTFHLLSHCWQING